MGDSSQRLNLHEVQQGGVNPFFQAQAQRGVAGATGDLAESLAALVNVAPQEEDDDVDAPNQTLRVVDWMQFLVEPIQGDGVVYCRLDRVKQPVGPTIYKMFLEREGSDDRFLMGAQKIKGSRTANYHIFTEENEALWKEKKYIGKLRSAGNKQYLAYDGGQNPKKGRHKGDTRREMAAIMFDLGQGSTCPRKLTVALPRGEERIQPQDDRQGMLEEYMMGRTERITVLHNKSPRYNEGWAIPGTGACTDGCLAQT